MCLRRPALHLHVPAPHHTLVCPHSAAPSCLRRPAQHLRIPAELFRDIDEAWGPHTVDRFASPDNVQPLSALYAGRFCLHY